MIETIKSVLYPQKSHTEIKNPLTNTQYILWFGGILLYSLFIFGLYGYLGIGSENLSVYMESLKDGRWEMAKFIFFIGGFICLNGFLLLSRL